MSAFIQSGRFGAAPGSWTPASLPGLVLWYDPDTESYTDGAAFTTFHDRSGNGKDAANAAAGNGAGPNMESTTPNAVNNKKRVQLPGWFAGAGAGFTIASGVTMGSGGSYMAMAMADTDPGVGAFNGPILDGFGNTSRYPQTDGHIYDGFGSTTFRDFGNPTPALTGARIYSCHSASNDHRAYLDGTLLASFGTNTVNFNNGGSRLIGRSADNGNGFLGFLGMIVVTSTIMSTGDREKCEGYFAWRYGLTGNLPGGHPYISSPP